VFNIGFDAVAEAMAFFNSLPVPNLIAEAESN
jgi:hypothetical protein